MYDMMSSIVGERNRDYWCMVIRSLIVLAMLCVTSGDDRVALSEGDMCTTLSNERGICTIIWECEVYLKGLRSKTITYASIFRCGFIGAEEVVCCPLQLEPMMLGRLLSTISTTPIATLTSIVTEPPKKAPVTIAPKERPSQAACREWKALDPAGLLVHILNGVPVPPGLYAHVGALMQPVQAGGKNASEIRCGSSLINERYVLTAAHCVADAELMPTIVRFGVVSLTDENNSVDVKIEDIYVHPHYRYPKKYHDIAVIKLLTNVTFTTVIRPVCLYSDVEDVDSSKQLTVIGWGYTNVNTRALSDVLLMANVTTIPLSICHESYQQRRMSLNFGQYCAMDVELENKRDSCQADSGGPLHLSESGVTNVVGVVSFGLSCGSDLPSIYTRVAFYLDWIESVGWPSEI